MRFRIVFDKDLVTSKYSKSWFIIDKEDCLTSEVLSQVSALFFIHSPCHAELDGFLIPDTQVFEKIVKEGEIVHIKTGKFSLNLNQRQSFVKKPEKKIVKEESEESSVSESRGKKGFRKGNNKNTQRFIEESSDSSSESIIKPVIKKRNTGVMVKSLLVTQPEPEFRPEVRQFDLKDFEESKFELLKEGDEVVFKSLELREDNTPGMSDYRLGEVMEKTEDNVVIRLLNERNPEEIRNLASDDLLDELDYEKYVLTLEKGMIYGLMKKKKTLGLNV